jgi:multicomponent K+:H+ antiporter subunit D
LSATLAVSALFLLVELVERIGAESRPRLRDVDFAPDEDTNLDDDELPLVGRVVPVSLAVLGLAFMACTVLVAGLPPLSGFIAKFSLLKAALGEGGDVAGARWAFFALLLLAGLAATVALTRAGIRHFWSSGAHGAPQLKSVEIAAVLALILCGVALAVNAERVLRYTHATADALHSPDAYIEAVLSARPVPPPPAAGQGASP